MLLRLLGQGGKRRLDREVVLPLGDMSDDWLIKTFFELKREGMRRGIISRHGYRKRQREVQGNGISDRVGGS